MSLKIRAHKVGDLQVGTLCSYPNHLINSDTGHTEPMYFVLLKSEPPFVWLVYRLDDLKVHRMPINLNMMNVHPDPYHL